MRKRLLVTMMVTALVAASIFGCSGGSDEGETTTASSTENDDTTTGDGESSTGGETENTVKVDTEPIVIEKSENGNPIGGKNAEGELTYGGDPAALVDGDTVYLYTGHDTSTGSSYVIPEYQVHSSKDLINWTYEGVVLSMKDVSWADKNSAWAGQVAKHYDETKGKDMYYLYFCSWANTDSGKQSIGVAVSESPTGPFTDIGQPLIKGSFTTNETSGWNDIDPTIWIEKDANGVEHRYLAWGNGKYFVCELNEDMISVKDLNGDGKIEFGVDVLEKTAPANFTEAPWIYRQKDDNGNYYGQYYLFYASGWEEQLSYVTTDDLLNGQWDKQGLVMSGVATSNTNHPSVIDFNGKTYLIYHNGSLVHGNGYRRVACIEELTIAEDGKVNYLIETATGLGGTKVQLISSSGEAIVHDQLIDLGNDDKYVNAEIFIGLEDSCEFVKANDIYWEIVAGLCDTENENYVSIEAYNKPGTYITATEDGVTYLEQNWEESGHDAQTYKTVKGLNGEGVSFESVKYAGKFLMLNEEGQLVLGDGSDKAACTFTIETVE